jgi:hypothetical protein
LSVERRRRIGEPGSTAGLHIGRHVAPIKGDAHRTVAQRTVGARRRVARGRDESKIGAEERPPLSFMSLFAVSRRRTAS